MYSYFSLRSICVWWHFDNRHSCDPNGILALIVLSSICLSVMIIGICFLFFFRLLYRFVHSPVALTWIHGMPSSMNIMKIVHCALSLDSLRSENLIKFIQFQSRQLSIQKNSTIATEQGVIDLNWKHGFNCLATKIGNFSTGQNLFFSSTQNRLNWIWQTN